MTEQTPTTEPTTTGAAGATAATADTQTSSSVTSSPERAALLGDDDRTDLRARWRTLEERFVDDPAGTVDAADDLVGDVVDHLRVAHDDQRAQLRARWQTTGDATTEQLREALHAYEQLFEQLADTRAPGG